MGMRHHYTFFDRATTDTLWSLSWKNALKRYSGNWFHSTALERGAYTAKSLRELLAFSIDPEPSDAQLAKILDGLTVAKTMQRCHPQFWTMEELITEVSGKRSNSLFTIETRDVGDLISVAACAFLGRRITAARLWTVAKLHSVQFDEWVVLDAIQSKTIKSALPWQRMWEPIFSWQDENACLGDEWTNCLNVAQTRRFIDFVLLAYRENWSALHQIDEPISSGLRNFRDLPDCVLLAKSIERRVAKMQRPCVFRIWG
jgi:hypothetical protein